MIWNSQLKRCVGRGDIQTKLYDLLPQKQTHQMRYKCDKKFPFMHIKLALKSHFNLMDSFWEIPKKVENGCNFEGGRLTYKTKPFPSLNTWIYCLNTIFFMVHLALPLFFSILSSSSIFSKVAFFKNHRPKHLNFTYLWHLVCHKSLKIPLFWQNNAWK